MQVYFLADYQKSKLRIREHFKQYNQQLKLAKGPTYKSESLKSCILSTAEAILASYGGYLQDNRLKRLTPASGFILNVNALSRARGNHRSTITRHLDILYGCGFLQKRQNLGNRKGVEVVINPDLLVMRIPVEKTEFDKLREIRKYIPEFNLLDFLKTMDFKTYPCGSVRISEITQRLLAQRGYVAKCDTLVKEKLTNINTESKKDFPVDKVLKVQKNEPEDLDTVPDFLRAAVDSALKIEKGHWAENFGLPFQKQLNRTGRGDSYQKTNVQTGSIFFQTDYSDVRHRIAGDDPALQASVNAFTNAAWAFARKTLYPDVKVFEHWQEEITRKRIREYFSLIPAERYNQCVVKLMGEFIQRLLLARNYVEKRPERYIPVPWKYFDKSFAGGFAGTRNWLEQVEERRSKTRMQYEGLRLVSNLYAHCTKDPSLIEKARAILSKNKNTQLREHFDICVVYSIEHYNKEYFRKLMT